ncbi:MAG: tandem-95 repeat protein, partial [Pseudomonadota bacterium]
SWTIEAWVNTTDTGSEFNRIVTAPTSGSQTYSLLVTGGQAQIRFDSADGAQVAQGGTVADGTWHHIAGRYDATTGNLTLFVDGTAVTTTTTNAANGPVGGGADIEIGRFNSVFGEYYQGDIADVRIWSEARTDAQISQFRNSDLTPANHTNLKLYLPLDDDFSEKTANRTVTNFGATLVDGNAPVDGESIAEGETLTGRVTTRDADTGDTTTLSIQTNPTNGTAAVDQTGLYTYTPTAGFVGSDSFGVLVSDGQGGTAVQTINVTVTQVNEAPVAGTLNETTAEDTATKIDVLAASSDADGDALRINTFDTTASLGTISLEDNGTPGDTSDDTLTFTPTPGASGVTAFNYQVIDPSGETSTGTVNVTITAQNDPPVATLAAPQAASVGADTTTITSQLAASTVSEFHTTTLGNGNVASLIWTGSDIRVLLQNASGAALIDEHPSTDGVGSNSSDHPEGIVDLGFGSFVALWSEGRQNLRAQVFDYNGQRDGDEIILNSSVSFFDTSVAAIKTEADDLAIAYSSWDGAQYQLILEVYDNSGQLQSTASGFGLSKRISDLDVEEMSNGNFAISFIKQNSTTNEEVSSVAIVQPDGTVVAEPSLNTPTISRRNFNSSGVTELENGNLAVVHNEHVTDNVATGSTMTPIIYILSPTGTQVRSPFRAVDWSGDVVDGQRRPVIEALPDGGFVVAFVNTAAQNDTNGANFAVGTYMQQFNADGTLVGGVQLVTTNGATGMKPEIEVLGNGDVLVTTVGAAGVLETKTFEPQYSQLIVVEDSALAFNRFSVSDEDATGALLVTVAATNGLLTTSGASGTTTSAAGQTLTLSGTQAEVNASLALLTYTPNAGFNGTDTITLTVNDQGGTGAGGAQTANQTLGVIVTEVETNQGVNDTLSPVTTGGQNQTPIFFRESPGLEAAAISEVVDEAGGTPTGQASFAVNTLGAGSALYFHNNETNGYSTNDTATQGALESDVITQGASMLFVDNNRDGSRVADIVGSASFGGALTNGTINAFSVVDDRHQGFTGHTGVWDDVRVDNFNASGYIDATNAAWQSFASSASNLEILLVDEANANNIVMFSYTAGKGTIFYTTLNVTYSSGTGLSEESEAFMSSMMRYVSRPNDLHANEDTVLYIPVEKLTANDNGNTNSVTAVGTSSTQGGSVSVVGDFVRYDPRGSTALNALNKGQEATDTFTYTITDATGSTSTATVSLQVWGRGEGATPQVGTAGNDTFTYSPSSSLLVFDGGDGNDTLAVASTGQQGTINYDFFSNAQIQNIERLDLNAGNDIINVELALEDILDMSSSRDVELETAIANAAPPGVSLGSGALISVFGSGNSNVDLTAFEGASFNQLLSEGISPVQVTHPNNSQVLNLWQFTDVSSGDVLATLGIEESVMVAGFAQAGISA